MNPPFFRILIFILLVELRKDSTWPSTNRRGSKVSSTNISYLTLKISQNIFTVTPWKAPSSIIVFVSHRTELWYPFVCIVLETIIIWGKYLEHTVVCPRKLVSRRLIFFLITCWLFSKRLWYCSVGNVVS